MLNSLKDPGPFALALIFMTAQNIEENSTFLERMISDKDLYADLNLKVCVHINFGELKGLLPLLLLL